MVLSKELQNLVDVEYSGDQENATVYVEVSTQMTMMAARVRLVPRVGCLSPFTANAWWFSL